MDKSNSNIMIGSILFILLIVFIVYFYRDKIPFLNPDDPETRLAKKGIVVQSGLNVTML